jgi:hypothetical protein
MTKLYCGHPLAVFLAVSYLIMAVVTGAATPPSTSSLLDTAGDLVARALSSSNVLTLNLTNVVILVVLKIIIFVGGMFVLNSTSGGTYGRAEDVDAAGNSKPAVTPNDLRGGMCFLLYTSGAEDRLGCLLQAACEDPLSADRYLQAAGWWQQAHQMFKT